jgi:hypothetical protein
MTDEELKRLIVEKLIQVINDPDDPADMHFAAWHSSHGLSGDCDMPRNIIVEALNRLEAEQPEQEGEYREDFVHAQGLITVDAVLVVNVDGRQFLVADDRVGLREVTIVHELKPPLNFRAKQEDDVRAED